MSLRILTLAIVLMPTSSIAADRAVELKVIVPKEAVALDLTAAQKAVKAASEPRGDVGGFQTRVPVTLRIVNNTDAAVTFNFGSDASSYTLAVKGPGVEPVFNPVAQTSEFRIGKPVTLAPGKTFDIELKALEFGSRGKGNLLIITKPGEYTLDATYQMATGDEKGPLLKATPVKFSVVEPK